MAKRTLLFAVAAVVFTAGLRFGFIAETRHFSDFEYLTPGMDADLVWNAARLLNQHPIDTTTFELRALSAPVNVRVLSAAQRIIGEDLFLHRLLYAGFSTLAAGLLFGFTFRLSGRAEIAALAVVLLSLQPTWIYLSTLPVKSTLTVGLGVALLWVAYETTQARSARTSLVFAALHFQVGGLLFLTQRNTIVMWLLTTIFTVAAPRADGRRRVWIAVVQGLCLFLAVVSASMWSRPTAENYPQAGLHIRLGHHAGADGAYSGIRGIPPTPIGHTFVARMAAEIEAGTPLTPSESNRHHLSAALLWIEANPAAFIRLTGRKVLLFFNDFAPNENYFLDELRGRSKILAAIPLGFGLLVITAAWGVVALAYRSQWSALFLLAGAVGGILTTNLAAFVTSRYRISAAPPLAVLGAIGLAFVVDRLHNNHRNGHRAGAAIGFVLAPAVLAAILAFYPVVSEDERASAMKTARANVTRSQEAGAALERLATLDSASPPSPHTDKERAFLLLRLQRLTEAYREFATLASRYRTDPQVFRQYLAMTVVAGDYDRAIELCRRWRRQFGWTDAEFLQSQEDSVRAILRRFVLPKI